MAPNSNSANTTWRPLLAAAMLCLCLPAAFTSAETEVLYNRLDQAPGLEPGVQVGSVRVPIINDDGRLLFTIPVFGAGVTSSNDRVVYTGVPGTLIPILRKGDQIAGEPEDVRFFSVDGLALNNNNQSLIIGTSTNPDAGDAFSGIFKWNAGTLTLQISDKSQAPDLDPGIFIKRLSPSSCCSSPVARFNDLGDMSLLAELEGVGVDSFNDKGIWASSNGALGLISREGELAPGSSTEILSIMTHIQSMNNHGEVAFFSITDDGRGRAIFTGTKGNLRAVVRSEDLIPGEQSTFGPVDNEPLINDLGQVAFQRSSAGIWIEDHGSIAPVARRGDVAAGTTGEATFNYIGEPGFFNKQGKVLYGGGLEGAGVTNNNNAGLWLGDTESSTLIVREGDPIPGGNGATFKVISATGLNDVGLVAFRAGQTSGDPDSLWLSDGIELVPIVQTGDIVGGTAAYNPRWLGGEDRSMSNMNNLGQVTFSVAGTNSPTAASNRAALFTPDLHWRGTAGDAQWDSPLNWTLSLDPAHVHGVFLDPQTDLTIDGPASDTTVKSLTVGGAGVVTLRLNTGGLLSVIEDVAAHPQGRVELSGGSSWHVGDTDGAAASPNTIVIGSGASMSVSATSRVTIGTPSGTTTDGQLRIETDGVVKLAGGTLDMRGQDIVPDASSGFEFTGGALVNVGVFATDLVQAGGTLAPGDTIGSTTIQGDYHMSASSTLQVDFTGEGQTAGVDFDKIDVTGLATLNGTLDINLLTPITPNLGDTTIILTTGSGLAGAFSHVLLPDTSHIGMMVRYEPDAVVLTAGVVGDLNADLFVGLEDLAVLLSRWNQTVPAGDWSQGDPSGDGLVGLEDLNLILNQWNAGTTGDLDFDGFVGIDDLNIVLGNWNQTVDAGVWAQGDPSGDGFIGIDDLNAVLGNWNAGTPPTNTANIPEPGMGLIAMGGLISLVLRRS